MEDTGPLVEKAKSGDQSAFGLLVKQHYQQVYGVVFSIIRDPEDAKEITQQTWVKAWKKIDTFKGDAAFTTWVYRIATFTAIDFIRSKQGRAEVDYEDDFAKDEDLVYSVSSNSQNTEPRKSLESKEFKQRFEQELSRLSEKHRLALTLREIEGLSYEEIAQIMKCKMGTVMSRIFNARKTLQQKMKDLL